MPADNVKFTGLDDVRRALKRLPKEMRKREVQKALRPASRLIMNTAKSLAPTGKKNFRRSLRGSYWEHNIGTLRDSIAIRSEKKKFLKDTARLKIGVLWNKRNPNDGAFYWRFVEFGTSKVKAQPFLTTAFMANRFLADKMIKDDLRRGVERQAKRVRRR